MSCVGIYTYIGVYRDICGYLQGCRGLESGLGSQGVGVQYFWVFGVFRTLQRRKCLRCWGDFCRIRIYVSCLRFRVCRV